MPGLGYLCALVLAAVFIWAAAAKLAHPPETKAGFTSLGLARPEVMAWLVPAVEILTAVLLVGAPRVGGFVALALLAAFSLVIARAIMRGVTTGCTCFGSVSSKPVSPTDLGRNCILAALALVAGSTPAPALPPWWAIAAVAVAAVLWFTALRPRR